MNWFYAKLCYIPNQQQNSKPLLQWEALMQLLNRIFPLSMVGAWCTFQKTGALLSPNKLSFCLQVWRPEKSIKKERRTGHAEAAEWLSIRTGKHLHKLRGSRNALVTAFIAAFFPYPSPSPLPTLLSAVLWNNWLLPSSTLKSKDRCTPARSVADNLRF